MDETRPKAIPDFRVFEEREDGLFELLTKDKPTKAANKKQAVVGLVESRNGRFLAIKEKEFDPKTRMVDEEPPAPPRFKERWS